MNKILKRMFLGLVMFVGSFGFNSCDNSLNYEPNPNDSIQVQLVKNPDVITYSGEQVLGSTFGTKTMNIPAMYSNAGDGDLNNQEWKKFDTSSLKNITDDERRAVLDAINAKVTGSKISEDVVFPWTDYFLQDVISGQNGNYEGAGSNGTSSSSYTFEAWNTGSDCSVQNPWYTDTNHPGEHNNYENVTNSGHLNNYYQKVNEDNSQERINETTLMTGMQYGTYEQMKGKQFRWYINCHENLHWYEYIVVEVDGSYYICFDFGCGYPENDKDGHAGKGAEHNDWDYNDWILKITPAGNQPNIWIGEQPNNPSQPDIEMSDITSEVEVNLSILDEHNYDIADLVTKLSIHVRAATDVKIVIPVVKEYYCDVDDMFIFNEHYDGVYGGAPESIKITHNINGNNVSLYIEFNDDNITIWTDGINENVFEYCKTTFKDGLNFEVYNYFNNVLVDENGTPILDENGKIQSTTPELNREKLQEMLNESTIEFLDDCPNYYINAFNKTEKGEKFDGDCNVSIIQSSEFNEPNENCWHINNSNYNIIYKNKNFDGPDREHDHNWLWK